MKKPLLPPSHSIQQITKHDAAARLASLKGSCAQEARDGVVYHYTSLAAFAGVLSAKQLFCTDYRHLNDTSEFMFGLGLLELLLADRGEAFGLTKDDVAALTKHLALMQMASMNISIFVGSFSRLRNDLSQWRAYAPNEGVCIGFNEKTLSEIGARSGFQCANVWYYNGEMLDDWADSVLRSLGNPLDYNDGVKISVAEGLNVDPEEVAELWSITSKYTNLEMTVACLSSLIKRPDFRSEAEFRCSYVLRENTRQLRHPVNFRTLGNRVIPYVALDLSSAKGDQLINEIIVGPSPQAHRNLQLVCALQRQSDWSFTVTLPDHFYRP